MTAFAALSASFLKEEYEDSPVMASSLGLTGYDGDHLLDLEVCVRRRAQAGVAPLLDHAERRRLRRLARVEPRANAGPPLDERGFLAAESDWSDHSAYLNPAGCARRAASRSRSLRRRRSRRAVWH